MRAKRLYGISGRILKLGPCFFNPLTFIMLTILYKWYHPSSISFPASQHPQNPRTRPAGALRCLSTNNECLICLPNLQPIYPKDYFNFNLSNLVPSKNIFQISRQNAFPRQPKAKRIKLQYKCTVRYVTRNSLGKRKIIINGNWI